MCCDGSAPCAHGSATGTGGAVRWCVAAVVLAVGLLGGAACGWAPTERSATPSAPPGTGARQGADPPGQLAQAPAPRQLTGSLHGLSAARLTVGDPAARVNLRVTDLPGLLYRVSTPAGSGLAPTVTGADGTLRLRLRVTGDDGPDRVDVLLNRGVRWRIRLAAGAGEQHLDLRAARLDALDLGAGVGLVRVRLPPPRGTVAIRVIGTVGRLDLLLWRAVPVRLHAGGGAAAVSVPGVHRVDVPPDWRWAANGWTTAVDRYRVDARAPVGVVRVRG